MPGALGLAGFARPGKITSNLSVDVLLDDQVDHDIKSPSIQYFQFDFNFHCRLPGLTKPGRPRAPSWVIFKSLLMFNRHRHCGSTFLFFGRDAGFTSVLWGA